MTDWHVLRLTLDLAGFLLASAWFIGHLLVVYRAVGSVPAFIRVFSFHWPDRQHNLCGGPDCHYETWKSLGWPDGGPGAPREGDFGCGGEISWIVEDGQYGCDGGWCDKRGDVHST